MLLVIAVSRAVAGITCYPRPLSNATEFYRAVAGLVCTVADIAENFVIGSAGVAARTERPVSALSALNRLRSPAAPKRSLKDR